MSPFFEYFMRIQHQDIKAPGFLRKFPGSPFGLDPQTVESRGANADCENGSEPLRSAARSRLGVFVPWWFGKSSRSRGFTLIEMLIVIIIIGMLASLLAVGLSTAMRTSRMNATQTMLDTINGALAQYRTRWGNYPPSTIDELKGKAPNETNNGIEALVACLSSKQRGGALYQPPGDEQYINTDGDKASGNVTDWFFGDNALREYADIFGQALVYIHHKDYEKPSARILKYKFRPDGKEETVRVFKSGHTGAFWRHDKVQLWSVGDDGKVDTADDVRVSN